jgi:hypothetical protein
MNEADCCVSDEFAVDEPIKNLDSAELLFYR